MTEYMHLTGTETVQRAANTMRDAAEIMQRALSWHQETLENQRRWMDEWLERFESVLAESKETKE